MLLHPEVNLEQFNSYNKFYKLKLCTSIMMATLQAYPDLYVFSRVRVRVQCHEYGYEYDVMSMSAGTST